MKEDHRGSENIFAKDLASGKRFSLESRRRVRLESLTYGDEKSVRLESLTYVGLSRLTLLV